MRSFHPTFHYLPIPSEAPITSALANGLKSLEVDVFPGPEETCLVAHTKFGLSGERTLTKYIKPLLKHLDATSRQRKAVVPRVRKRDSIIKFIGRRQAGQIVQAGQQLRRGAKDGPIKLLIDIKRSPSSVLPLLEKNLKPLSKYLTTYDENGDIKEGLVTVLLSGDVGGIKRSLQNGIFFLDGRISDISTSKSNTTPLVSVNYRTLIYSSIIRLKSRSKMINEICEKAHDKGKQVRIFGCPNNEKNWDEVLRRGVDVISVDEHKKFRKFCARRLGVIETEVDNDDVGSLCKGLGLGWF
ncbi:hypothetical protein TrVE_jg10243 [Triparma verrucosa]|uniref:Uncharacterized protein n=1 Tax=Triparma verrucosa TaxID=1606542 RepID=A0A9W7EMJ6_9STRA|nr:hypothetical protein TrVE_jg10243 [Triparma verrucosa]